MFLFLFVFVEVDVEVGCAVCGVPCGVCRMVMGVKDAVCRWIVLHGVHIR